MDSADCHSSLRFISMNHSVTFLLVIV
uniref:Uncharacterized protein n=1 Tax=Anguilla anguilla TaxID=7936 RepID=A0A0E9WNC4_ANGAN